MRVSRRAMLAQLGAACLPTALRAPEPAAAAPPKPNIVVIVFDDMRTSGWSVMTKTNDLIGSRGTTFPNFFLTSPLCCPSRTSILTGQYTHNRSVRWNSAPAGGWARFRQGGIGADTVNVGLRQAGYRTGLFGKFLNGYEPNSNVPQDWDVWLGMGDHQHYDDFTLNNNGHPKHYAKGYLTEVLGKESITFVNNTPDDTPLFLYIGFKAPHGPYTAVNRYRKAFADRGATDPTPPSTSRTSATSRATSASCGRSARSSSTRSNAAGCEPSPPDDAIGSIWEALDQAGRLANTYVFVLSDNGYMLGQHRVRAKVVPYDGAVRVPMLAYGPGFAAGRTDNRVAVNIDVAPTIAGIAGIGLPKADGRSLLDSWDRADVLIEVLSGPHQYTALRGRDFLYVENKSSALEYYDERNDSHELNNLLADWEGHTPDPSVPADRLHQELVDAQRCKGPGNCP